MTFRSQTAIRGVFSVGVVNSAARIVSYGKHVVITAYIGLTAQLDAFYMAATVIGIVIYVFGDVFDSLGIPRLVEAQQEEGEESFLRLTGSIFTLSVLLSAILVSLLLVASPLARYVAPGFAGEERELILTNLYLMVPVGLLYLPYHAIGSFLRARRRFQAFYMGELLIALVTLAVVYLFHETPFIIPISFSVAYAAAIAWLVFAARGGFRFTGTMRDDKAREIIRMFFRLVPLYAVFHLFGFVDRVFASYLPTGGVSALTYAALIAGIPVSLLMIENVFITPLSEAEDKGRLMQRIASGILILAVPIAFFVVAFAREIVQLAFQRGAFTQESTEMTARALRYYALAIPAGFLWPICYRLLQVLRRMDGVVASAIFAVATNAVLNYVFLKAGLGIAGLALATAIANYLLLFCCVLLLSRRGVPIVTRGLVKVLLTSTGIAGAGVLAASRVPWGEGSLTSLLGPATVFLGIVAGLLLAVPRGEIREWRNTVIADLLPRRSSR